MAAQVAGRHERPELRTAADIIKKFRLQPPETTLTRLEIERLALLGAEQLPNGAWAFRFDPETRAWRKHGIKMTRPKIRQIKMPTLLLRGDKSGLVSPSHVAADASQDSRIGAEGNPARVPSRAAGQSRRHRGSDHRIRREAVVDDRCRPAFGEMPRRRSLTFLQHSRLNARADSRRTFHLVQRSRGQFYPRRRWQLRCNTDSRFSALLRLVVGLSACSLQNFRTERQPAWLKKSLAIEARALNRRIGI